MDVEMARALVSMRQEQIRHQAAAGRVRRAASPEPGRRGRLRLRVLRMAMWAFGPGVVAPRHLTRRPGGRGRVCGVLRTDPAAEGCG